MRASIALAVATAALSPSPASALDNGAAPLPPRGWSSWNSFKLGINEEVVKSSADIMAAELLSSGYEYLLIDDGWPPDSAHYKGKGPARLSDGTIPVSAEKFPSGFKNLTEYVHAKGLKIGIYTAVSHWTCGGFTGSLGHEETDAKSFVDWGFDFVKHDTCAGYNGEPADECGVGVLSKGNCIRNSTTIMSAALARLGAAATPPRKIVYYIDHGNPTSPQKLHNPKQYYIADTTNGRSDVSKVAVTPDELGWTWAAGVCHMMKTTFDTNDSWQSMLNNLHASINLPEYQQRGYYSMPDMLSVGQGKQSNSQYRAQMLLWAVMGGPMILGNDIRQMDPFIKDLITAPEVLAVNADPDVVQGSFLRADGSYEIWGKPIGRRVDMGVGVDPTNTDAAATPAFVVVMFNKGDAATQVVLQMAGDGAGGDLYPAAITGPYEVRDLLLQKDLGVHVGHLQMMVPATDAVMLQIVPKF